MTENAVLTFSEGKLEGTKPRLVGASPTEIRLEPEGEPVLGR